MYPSSYNNSFVWCIIVSYIFRIKSEVTKQEREKHKGPSRQGVRINSSKRRQLCLSSKEASDLSFLEIEVRQYCSILCMYVHCTCI